MIRALALTALLPACSYDATLGFRPTANSDSDASTVDVSTMPDAPANLAFDYGGDVGGPILYDGSSYVYAIQAYLSGWTPQELVRFDTTTKTPTDVAVPVIAMAQDATTIYALAPGSAPGLFNVVAISKSPSWAPPPDGNVDAGAPTFTTTTLQNDLPDAAAIAVDASAIFVVQSGSADGKLIRMDKNGANASTLLTAAGLTAVAVDGSYAYVVEHVPHGRLLALPKTGGSALVLATGLAEPLDIDLAFGDVYITEQGDASTGGAIGRVVAPASGAGQADVGPFVRIVVGAHTPVDLTHDASYVYWTADRDGLMRAPLAGGTPELRMGTATPGNAAVSVQDDYVLFVAPSDSGGRAVHAVQR